MLSSLQHPRCCSSLSHLPSPPTPGTLHEAIFSPHRFLCPEMNLAILEISYKRKQYMAFVVNFFHSIMVSELIPAVPGTLRPHLPWLNDIVHGIDRPQFVYALLRYGHLRACTFFLVWITLLWTSRYKTSCRPIMLAVLDTPEEQNCYTCP
jgi:hypothetical protein